MSAASTPARSPDEEMRRLKAAWGAARFVTWKQFIRYFNSGSRNYSPEAIAAIDRIFAMHDVNGMIEARLSALKNGDTLEASRIRGELLAAGIELTDERAPVSGTITTHWELTP
jgi:cysteinyl-tRNA synthetase